MKETQQKQPGQSQTISQYLKGANFPADRDELQRTAKRNGAPTDVVDSINRLPNQRFNTENDVTNAFNQVATPGGQTGGQERGGQGGGQPRQNR